MKLMKKVILSSIIPLVGFSTIASAEDCQIRAIERPIAWDYTYEYQKQCEYKKHYRYWDSKTGERMEARGDNSYKTHWSEDYDSLTCHATIPGYVTHRKVYDPFSIPVTRTESLPFERAIQNKRESGLIPTEWETSYEWLNEKYEKCTPR